MRRLPVRTPAGLPSARRRFLALSLGGTAALVAGWRFFPPLGLYTADAQRALPSLRNLGRGASAVLAAAYSALSGDADPPSNARALKRMDVLLGKLPRWTRLELWGALWILELSPPALGLGLTGFARLDLAGRTAALGRWQTGPDWARPLFLGLKELCLLGRYADASAWSAIGYGGPRVDDAPPGDPDAPSPAYAALVALPDAVPGHLPP